MTLVDSSIAETARKSRNWQLVYNLIPRFKLYDGFETVFEFIKSNDIKVAIVSTSPTSYIRKVCDHFNIPYDHIVGYHDAKPIKPHPAPMIKALDLLNTKPEDTVSFGDRQIDITASKAANIPAIGCYWGTTESDALSFSKPTLKINSPIEIKSVLSWY